MPLASTPLAIGTLKPNIVFASNNAIVIEGINAGETYSVYNAMGAMMASGKANSTVVKVELNNSGVYIVQVGNIVRKIVK